MKKVNYYDVVGRKLKRLIWSNDKELCVLTFSSLCVDLTGGFSISNKLNKKNLSII